MKSRKLKVINSNNKAVNRLNRISRIQKLNMKWTMMLEANFINNKRKVTKMLSSSMIKSTS